MPTIARGSCSSDSISLSRCLAWRSSPVIHFRWSSSFSSLDIGTAPPLGSPVHRSGLPELTLDDVEDLFRGRRFELATDDVRRGAHPGPGPLGHEVLQPFRDAVVV